MDISVLQPVDRGRLSTILEEALGVSIDPALSTQDLMAVLEAELSARQQKFNDAIATKEAALGELAAWRSGALTLADCTCQRVRVSPTCVVHGSARPSNPEPRLAPPFAMELEQLAQRMREPRGSVLCQRDRDLCASMLEDFIRRHL